MTEHAFYTKTCRGFQFIVNSNITHIRHLVYGCSLERHEHVVFIRKQEFIHWRHNVVTVSGRDEMFWELPDYIIAFIERIGQCPTILPAMIFETISSITAQEPVRIEIGSGHGAQS